MPPRCRICTHPKRSKIEAQLSSGMVLSKIERQFGISDTALSRHRKRCMQQPQNEVPPSPAEDLDLGSIKIERPQDVLDIAQRILGRLDRLAATAERDGDVRGAVSAMTALNKSLTDLFAKVHGLISDQPIVDQRSIVIQQHIAGAPATGLRAMLELLSRLGEERVAVLIAAIEGHTGAEIERIITQLADENPKAIAS